MPDHQCRAHADIDARGVLELPAHQVLGGLCDGFEPLDKERRNARNELHHGAHLDAQAQDVRDAVHDLSPTAAAQAANEDAHQHTQQEGFSQHTELLFHAFRVNVQLTEAGNAVHAPVQPLRKGNEALAEGLRDGDAFQVLVIALEFPRG